MRRRQTFSLLFLLVIGLSIAEWYYRKYASASLQALASSSKIELFNSVEKLAPNDPSLPPLLQRLIYQLRSKEEFQRFIPIAQAALDSTEHLGLRVRIKLSLGTAYAGVGDVDRARDIFNQVAQDLPAGPTFEAAKSRLYDLDNVRLGLPAPDFSELGTDGTPVRVSDFRGSVVLLDFWSTWCAPCVEQLPDIKRLQEKFSSRGLVVLWISLDHDRDQFEKMLTQEALTGPVIYGGKDWESDIAKLYNVRGIPAYYLIDRQGRIAGRNLSKDVLEEETAKLLNE